MYIVMLYVGIYSTLHVKCSGIYDNTNYDDYVTMNS